MRPSEHGRGYLDRGYLEQELSVGSEDLHPGVCHLGDVYIARRVHGKASWDREFPGPGSEHTPGFDELAFRCEDLQTVVAPIDDDNIAVHVNGDSAGGEEPAGIIAELPPFVEVVAFGVEHLDSLVQSVT